MSVALQVEQLVKTYPGTRKSPPVEAVRGLSFEVPSGELFGLLGPNGAGKTTLLSILATVTRPSAGTFAWQGRDGLRDPFAVRRELGYLPQDFGLHGQLTARELLRYVGRLKGLSGRTLERRLGELLEVVNLRAAADRRLSGYSGGMRQRVGIAQALLADPRLLVVDEPTVGLDPEERVRFRNLLAEVARERVVLLSTHIVSDVEAVATRIAILIGGRLLVCESPDELLRRAAGHVLRATVTPHEVPALSARLAVSGLVRRADEVTLRFVVDDPAAAGVPGAEQVEPTLEDAYLLLRGRSAAGSPTRSAA